MTIQERLESLPPYVAGEHDRFATKMSSNENALGPSRLVLERIKAEMEQVHRYPDPHAKALRQALSTHLEVDPSQLSLGNGSDDLIVRLAHAILQPGDSTVVPAFTFPQYRFATTLAGGVTIEAPMQGWNIDTESMLAAITPRTRIVFLCNPNNPTGTWIRSGELVKFLRAVPQDILVAIDEAYVEFVEDDCDFPDSLALQKDHPNVLILRTFSKAYGLAGMRVGYAIGTESLIAKMNRVRLPFGVNHLAQVAAVAALEDTQHLQETLANNAVGKAFLLDQLGRLGVFHTDSQGNFLFLVLGEQHIAPEQELRQLGVNAKSFPLSNGGTGLRITIGTPRQNQIFVDCLRRYLKSNPSTRATTKKWVSSP